MLSKTFLGLRIQTAAVSQRSQYLGGRINHLILYKEAWYVIIHLKEETWYEYCSLQTREGSLGVPEASQDVYIHYICIIWTFSPAYPAGGYWPSAKLDVHSVWASKAGFFFGGGVRSSHRPSDRSIRTHNWILLHRMFSRNHAHITGHTNMV